MTSKNCPCLNLVTECVFDLDFRFDVLFLIGVEVIGAEERLCVFAPVYRGTFCLIFSTGGFSGAALESESAKCFSTRSSIICTCSVTGFELISDFMTSMRIFFRSSLVTIFSGTVLIAT